MLILEQQAAPDRGTLTLSCSRYRGYKIYSLLLSLLVDLTVTFPKTRCSDLGFFGKIATFRFRVKYLNSYWMDNHEIWDGHSQSQVFQNNKDTQVFPLIISQKELNCLNRTKLSLYVTGVCSKSTKIKKNSWVSHKARCWGLCCLAKQETSSLILYLFSICIISDCQMIQSNYISDFLIVIIYL